MDEYQDIGEVEYALIAAVAGRSLEDPVQRLSLFAVGDDDQNIYAFKWSKVSFIRQFEEDYRAKPKYLTENYRSTRYIIDAANQVIEPARGRMKSGHPITVDKMLSLDSGGGAMAGYDPVGKPRFLLPAFKSAEKTIDAWLLTEKVAPAPVDGTFYLGAQHDPVLVKVMDKVIDQQNRKAGTCKILTDVEKRVRIEVTLKSRELKRLGLHHLEDLREFSFTALQGNYFRFKLPTFEATDAKPGSALSAARDWRKDQLSRRFLTAGVMGLELMRHAREAFRDRHRSERKRHIRRTGGKMIRNRRGTGATGTLVAYEDMNRLVSNALGELGRTERTAWRKAERIRVGAAATAVLSSDTHAGRDESSSSVSMRTQAS